MARARGRHLRSRHEAEEAKAGVPTSCSSQVQQPERPPATSMLRARIESGELPPRRAVPSKRMLMQEFGIAGGTVDRAIDILRGEGLVRTVTGRGIYVVPPSER